MNFTSLGTCVLYAGLAGLFTWGITALGAAMVLLTRRFSSRGLDCMLGFGAGVMLASSFWSLLLPGLNQAEALAMNESGADVVVPVNQHGYEPFHAMYRRMGCLPAVRRALDRGEKRAQGFFADVEVCEFPQERVLEAEPMGGCFINANTPEELRAIEETFLEK